MNATKASPCAPSTHRMRAFIFSSPPGKNSNRSAPSRETFAVSRHWQRGSFTVVDRVKSPRLQSRQLDHGRHGRSLDPCPALVAGRVDATSLSVGTWITIQKEPGVRIFVDHNTFFENTTVVEKVNAATTKVLDENPSICGASPARSSRPAGILQKIRTPGSRPLPSAAPTSTAPTRPIYGRVLKPHGRLTA